MGIDAEILVRNVPALKVTDEWLKELSWQLCSSIGAKHFFISDGLPPSEYEAASKAWHEAFNNHPRYEEYRTAEAHRDRTAVHEAIFADIGKPPEQLRLAVERTLARYREDNDPPPGSEYREDSDEPIKARAGECLLELNVFGRYYGKGYERGDILTYCAMAEWLEANVPGCEVWYGGDSSGVCAEPFTKAKREDLKALLYSQSGRDYFNYRLSLMPGEKVPNQPPACGMCPGAVYHGTRCGYGRNGDYARFHCAGCGISVTTEDAGKTYTKVKDE
jgi:hypothetical protein